MKAVLLLLAIIQFALVGFGVTVVGSSELRNVAFGLALFAASFIPIPAVSVGSSSSA